MSIGERQQGITHNNRLSASLQIAAIVGQAELGSMKTFVRRSKSR